MARVVVCDSHSAVQKALEYKIGEWDDLELVCVTGAVSDLQAVLASHDVDVVILELTLPGAVGLDLIRDLKSRYEDLRIVVYTMYDEAVYAARAIRAGASGYVMKQAGTEKVMEVIRAALNDVFVSETIPPHLADFGDEPGDGRKLHPTNALTDPEMSVFQLLGEGRSIEEIAERLSLGRSQVEDLQASAQEKLRLESREALVQYASRLVHR